MKNDCNHVAIYWQHRAKIYRRLNWWRMWEMARYKNQRYFMLCIGALQEE